MSSAVLIVGAGPVGLALACELLRRDVDVRVIDRSRTPVAQSKAIIVWPRTLELLAATGVADEMADTGHRLAGVRFHADGSALGTVDVAGLTDTRFNHVLMLPQQETERILQNRHAELGGKVEWGVELVALRQSGAYAEAVLSDRDGRQETVRVPWLVGADGAHSRVRKLLGVEYAVHTPDMTFAIADAPVTGSVDDTHLHYCYSAHGALGVGPLGGGLFRFAVSAEPGRQPDRELFQAALDQRAGGWGTVGDPKWTALFQVRCATAERFRAGRVFLAGDAAHVVSPAGGQGLNTGFHDAANLGWKLAGVVHGLLEERVLDSYHTERHAAVRRISTITDKQTRWGLLTDPRKVFARNLLTRVADASGLLQRVTAPMLSQTDLTYGERSTADLLRHPVVRAGGRLPYLADECGSGGGPDSALPAVLLSPGRTAGTSWARIRATLPPGIGVRELGRRRGTAAGRLAALLGPEPRALLVRPDGHVLATATGDSPGPLLHALRSLITVEGR
ncbi:MAG: NAD(P)-binding protein [Nonomuraea sp.]|nr:NAD(P)-binding protein [Nonomuraea sp.]